MKKMSRVVFVLVIMAIALLPVYSSGQDETSSAENQEESKLVFWSVSYERHVQEAMRNLMEPFEEANPGVELEANFFPYGEYFQKLTTALAGGGMPDVFLADSPNIENYVYFNALTPLSDYLSAEDVDDLFPMPLKEATVDGIIYSYPMQVASDCIMYNKRMFEEAGLTAADSYDSAWTLDEFLQAAKELSKPSENIFGFSFHRSNLHGQQIWFTLAGQDEWISPDGKTVDGYLNSQNIKDMYKTFKQMVDEKVLPNEGVPDIFGRELTAMFEANPLMMKHFNTNFPDLDYGIMPMPIGVNRATNGGGFHLGVSSQTENEEKAVELLMSMTSKEGSKQWVETSGYLPARKSTVNEVPELQKFPYSLYLEQWSKAAISRPATPAYAFYHDKWNKAFNDIMFGADIDNTLDKLVKEIDAELVTY
ncbi:MAG: sugar ABC transporter substrate-binding protein [Bacteroidetes bacterium]|nr:sugar ABC transporter substrate-binding protein [Bacteroidota bacterium]